MVFLIVPGATALTFAEIINMRPTGPWETDWIVISSEQAMDLAGFVFFTSCFENVHARRSRDTVSANSGLIPRLIKVFGIQKKYVKILVVNMQHELAYPPPFS